MNPKTLHLTLAVLLSLAAHSANAEEWFGEPIVTDVEFDTGWV